MVKSKKIATKKFLKELAKDANGVLKGMDNSEIAQLIQEANHAYYNTKTALMSDAIYDVVVDYLKTVDKNNPVLKEVGAGIAKDDKRKEKLPFYMGSLDKIKGDVSKFVKQFPGKYVVSDKLDGNSALVYVDDAGIMKIYSRGNGTEGQNITHISKYIQKLPSKLEKHVKGQRLAVRGELIISKEDFEKVKHKGANARNMVAGAINAKLPDLEILGCVQFIGYEMMYPEGLTMSEQIEKMKCMGFSVVHNRAIEVTNMKEETLSSILVERRHKSPFEIDGIVVFHDGVAHKRKVGENPDYAFAFKSVQTLDKAETTVTRVEWNMSKDGYMIPVVNFTPVSLEGVVIQRASAFNAKYIHDHKLGPGSRIVIMRSGFVIPYIAEVLSVSETGEPQMPDVDYKWSVTGVDIIVSKEVGSSEMIFKNLEYFFNKIDVKGLSSGTLKKLFEAGYKTVKAVFEITVDEIKKIDGFKDKSAGKLYESLQTRRNELLKGGKNTCTLLLDASNTLGRGIGGKKLELVLEHIPKMIVERYIPSISELVAIKGIEKKTAEILVGNLNDAYKFLDENGFGMCFVDNTSSPVKQTVSPGKMKLVDEVVVFTGVRSKDAEAFIEANGGKVASGVSKKTTLLIAKDPNGSSNSIVKAREFDVKIISLDDFVKKYMV